MAIKRKRRARAGGGFEIGEYLNKRSGVGIVASAWDLAAVTNKPPDHVHVDATMGVAHTVAPRLLGKNLST